MQHLPNITSDLIRQYQEDLVEKFSPATVKRKSISIGKFLDWAKAEGILDSNLGNLFSAQKPAERTITAKSAGKTRFHNWYNRYQSIPGVLYLNIAVALILTSLVGLGIYNQFFRNAQSPFASPTFTQTRPNRFLSFQGRLTNQYDNPIATPSGIIFNLYDASSSGTLLWNSGTCTVSPDSDGVFSTLLGSGGCGTELTSDIFSQNAGVWLGVKVGNDSEATPRVQIATVAYALNAETLQGFPVDATGSATVNTVVTMNSGGQIVIAEAAPKIKSVSGTFAIEGQALTLTTPTASNGNITISPNGTGQLNLNFSGASPGSGTGMVNATGAQLTSGALYYGSVASNATGYNLLQLQAGSTPANRFTVDAVGNTTASGTINGLAISGGTVSGGSWNGSLISTTFGGTGANNSSAAQWSVPYYSTAGVMGGVLAPGGEGYVLTTHNTSGAPTWTNSASVGTNYWALGSGVIYPSYTTLDLLIGNSATTSAKFAFINVLKNTPTASISANSGSIATYLTGDGTLATTNMRSLTLGGTTTGNILIPNGNLGINNATPGNKFSLNSPTTADTLADALIGTSATTQKGLVIQGLSSQTA
ncbi:MAG: hypothetical protein NTZ07_02555, partial [Candidatus Woesebacteria bacterium]|nr:hypothetical protein [Candidatus Woesebacteria bacterium]